MSDIDRQKAMADILRRRTEGGLGYDKRVAGPQTERFLEQYRSSAPVHDRGAVARDIFRRNQ